MKIFNVLLVLLISYIESSNGYQAVVSIELANLNSSETPDDIRVSSSLTTRISNALFRLKNISLTISYIVYLVLLVITAFIIGLLFHLKKHS